MWLKATDPAFNPGTPHKGARQNILHHQQVALTTGLGDVPFKCMLVVIEIAREHIAVIRQGGQAHRCRGCEGV